jgi:hypothetical protein
LPVHQPRVQLIDGRQIKLRWLARSKADADPIRARRRPLQPTEGVAEAMRTFKNVCIAWFLDD